MAQENEQKRIERKAKALLLNKEIPPAKMDVVRSLLQNQTLVDGEKYRAIIELVQGCPDKPRSAPPPSPIEIRGRQARAKQPAAKPEAAKAQVDVAQSTVFVNDLHRKYKKLNFFKKRYLVHAENRFGIGFKKRLVPARRFFAAMNGIAALQEKLLLHYPGVLTGVLADESISDPTLFNLLVHLRTVISSVPLGRYNEGIVKWMERKDFENEFRAYTVDFFSFYLLSAETKEQMISLAEQRLREMDEFRKEIVNEKDPLPSKAEKEKRNLEREKKVYDYLYTLRAFLSAGAEGDNAASKYLNSAFGISSIPELLLVALEALVFQREIALPDVVEYFDIAAPVVSSTRWNYSMDVLKKFGKDPESQRKRKANELRKSLEPYEDLFTFLKFDVNGHSLLEKAFDEQWRLVDKKRGDSLEKYEEDFFSFIDGCVNHFNRSYMQVVRGGGVTFEDAKGAVYDSQLFLSRVFEREDKALQEVLREIFYLKSNNPNLVIPLQEAKKILRGMIKSMAHVEVLLKRVGSLFYSIGEGMHRVFELHRDWVKSGAALRDSGIIRSPLAERGLEEGAGKGGRPIPFYDCRIKQLRDPSPLAKSVTDLRVINPDLNDGFVVHVIAFAYQMALECQDETVLRDLESRKAIIVEIKELLGK
jgi:hypothetical protein